MNRQLKRKFNEYNRKYFGGRLPKDTVVDWHYDMPNDHLGATHVHGLIPCNQVPKSYGACGGRHMILLNTVLWNMPCVAEMTLLHEMVHLMAVNGNKKLAQGHGQAFNAEMNDLANQGAFDGKW